MLRGGKNVRSLGMTTNPYKERDRVIAPDGSVGIVCEVLGDTLYIRHYTGGLVICHYKGVSAR
jgi:hypothetical protein